MLSVRNSNQCTISKSTTEHHLGLWDITVKGGPNKDSDNMFSEIFSNSLNKKVHMQRFSSRLLFHPTSVKIYLFILFFGTMLREIIPGTRSNIQCILWVLKSKGGSKSNVGFERIDNNSCHKKRKSLSS